MDKDYIEVKIPILDSVDEMKVVKTFNQEQLWFVCAIAKAFEKSEQQVKKQKEVIDKIEKYIEKQARMYGLSMPIELGTHLDNILGILNEVSEWIKN
mgnify:CR=1 FL=1